MLDQSITDLYVKFETLVAEKGQIRAKDAADTLGVSEAELIEAKMSTGAAKRLTRTDDKGFTYLLEGMVGLGEVMCLTRNEHAVHERYGEFDNVKIGKVMGIVLNRTIDLRIFMNKWVYGFVLEEEVKSGLRVSLQFFDASGVAVHKIYPTDLTDRKGFDKLVKTAIDHDSKKITIIPTALPEADRPDADIDTVEMRKDWDKMTDVHQFFSMLKKNKVGRMQALRLAGNDVAYRVSPEAVTWALEQAAEKGVPIMVFIGSPGCIQIHTGEVENIKAMGPWINVLDEKFHMHLRQDNVAYLWVVRKPSADGTITSLEAYDSNGQNICMMFGERKEGDKELDAWRTLLSGLGQEAVA